MAVPAHLSRQPVKTPEEEVSSDSPAIPGFAEQVRAAGWLSHAHTREEWAGIGPPSHSLRWRRMTLESALPSKLDAIASPSR
jgi:hypothetical protein